MQWQVMGTCTKENVALANELVLSQEDQRQIRNSTSPLAQFALVWIIFSLRPWLEEMATEDLTEAISSVVQHVALQNSC